MSKLKVNVGDTLDFKPSLKKRSSFMYNVFNGKKVTNIIDVNSLKDAEKLDEDMANRFKLEGAFKVLVIDGRFGEAFITYNKISKYIK